MVDTQEFAESLAEAFRIVRGETMMLPRKHHLQAVVSGLAGTLGLVICTECDHELILHVDKYGCERDRGDGYRAGSEYLEALGPCGCKGGPLEQQIIALLRQVRG